jgi:hypothetical protein
MIQIRHATQSTARPLKGIGAEEWDEVHEITGLAQIAESGLWGHLVDIPAPIAGTTAAFTTALRNKLNGLQSGATANATDSFLLNRENHTGPLPASVITDLDPVSTPLSGDEFLMMVQGGVPRRVRASALTGQDAIAASAASQAWAEGTVPGGPGTRSAKEHAAAAQLWAQTIGQREGIFLSGDSIAVGIAYPLLITGPEAVTFGYLDLRVAQGTGSITVSLLAGDTMVLTDLTFDAQGPARPINLAVPAETILWLVINGIEAAPTAIVGRIEGA